MRKLLLAACLLVIAASPAAAKEYHAYRFDAHIEVMRGGALRVRETIVFAFTDGTFREVFRTVPTRFTDGVEFVSASMDGAVLPEGEGPGRVRVRRRNGLRVEWHFTPVSNSAHTFELIYIARGVVRQTADGELLQWRALPREHDYRIQSSTIEVGLPEPPSAVPQLEARRVDGGSSIAVQPGGVVARAAAVQRNGSLVLSVALPRGSVLDGPPAWQAAAAAQERRIPIWLSLAGGIVAAGFVLVFALRQSYDSPPKDTSVQWGSMIAPDHAAPAIAGALVANGSPRLEHAMATLFSLAERGILSIREEPKGMLGQRTFTIERHQDRGPLAPYEEAALGVIFGGASHTGSTVTLAKARSHLVRHFSKFKKAVQQALAGEHLLDPGRRASRRRFVKTGVALLGLALVAVIPCLLLADANGPWPMMMPAAIAVVAVSSLILSASMTPLSNDGLRRAAQWRGYRKHIEDPQSIEPRWGASGSAESRLLPLAVALGLSAAWAKYMKKRNAPTPAWFRPVSPVEGGHAFSVFVASGGAGTHGSGSGGMAGGGGVAGGGASGAR